MDRAHLRELLASAERHVEQREKTVARQRQIVAGLTREGKNTTAALDLLAAFERVLAIQVTERDRLRKELGC
jgi:hypothetical protein